MKNEETEMWKNWKGFLFLELSAEMFGGTENTRKAYMYFENVFREFSSALLKNFVMFWCEELCMEPEMS